MIRALGSLGRPRARAVVPVPRWVLVALAVLAMAWIGLRIGRAPAWTLQRLDSPDGRRSAVLQRTRYVHDHLRIRLKDGRLWSVPYYSPPYTNDFRVDLGERLRWSPDGATLYLQLGGRDAWQYDLKTSRPRDLNPLDAW